MSKSKKFLIFIVVSIILASLSPIYPSDDIFAKKLSQSLDDTGEDMAKRTYTEDKAKNKQLLESNRHFSLKDAGFLVFLQGSNVEKKGILGFVESIVSFFIKFIGVFALLTMVIGGLMLITSAGNDTRLQKGKDIILFSAVGLTAAFSSYMIVQFIIKILYNN